MQKTLQNVSQVFPLSSFIAQKSRIPKSNRWIETIYGITFSRKQASRILFNQARPSSFWSIEVKVEQKLNLASDKFFIRIWIENWLSMELKVEQKWVFEIIGSGSKYLGRFLISFLLFCSELFFQTLITC